VLVKILAGIVTGWLLLGFDFDVGLTPTVASALTYQISGAQNTNLMQQMDHRRRMTRQKSEQARSGDGAEPLAVVEADLSSASIDYAVVGILGVTGALLYAVCRRRGCWSRRRRRAPRQVRPRV
jgi:hypothetical protein